MPRIVAPAAVMTISQKLSWASGQWYLRRRSMTRTTSVVIVSEVVEVDEREREEGRKGGGRGGERGRAPSLYPRGRYYTGE